MTTAAGTPVPLGGSAYERGQAQAPAAGSLGDAVRSAVEKRLAGAGELLARSDVRDYLDRQWGFAEAAAPECLDETRGIADGFGIDARQLFAYLHLGVVGDFNGRPVPGDGCTAWAQPHDRDGAFVVKNRDFRGEHVGIQRVFLHADPAWGGRTMLCVGSFGSPGAYSSGINSDGLAVADTQIGTTEHGVGLVRYFVMTRLLARCADVGEALEEICATTHAGGGTLILGDAKGDVAAVELGSRAVAVEHGAGGAVGRTNHFVSAALDGRDLSMEAEAMTGSSRGRLVTLRAALGALSRGTAPEEAMRLMASHDGDGVTGLCRHGQDGDASTISCALFACRPAKLYFRAGNPCEGEWLTFVP